MWFQISTLASIVVTKLIISGQQLLPTDGGNFQCQLKNKAKKWESNSRFFRPIFRDWIQDRQIKGKFADTQLTWGWNSLLPIENSNQKRNATLFISFLPAYFLTSLLSFFGHFLETCSPVNNCSSPDDETPQYQLRTWTRRGNHIWDSFRPIFFNWIRDDQI